MSDWNTVEIVKEVFGVPIELDPDCPPDTAYLMPERNTVSYPNPRPVFVVGSIPSREFVESRLAFFRQMLDNHRRFHPDTAPEVEAAQPGGSLEAGHDSPSDHRPGTGGADGTAGRREAAEEADKEAQGR